MESLQQSKNLMEGKQWEKQTLLPFFVFKELI